jgi:hypothetical protein
MCGLNVVLRGIYCDQIFYNLAAGGGVLNLGGNIEECSQCDVI